MRHLTRPAGSLFLGMIVLVTVCATPANAKVISSSRALALEEGSADRALVDSYLSRADVAEQLSALGVDPELAQLRAAALSADELSALAGRIDQAPAGGDVIGILGVTFLVLLILELVGVIDIFKRV
jgi:Family of unknown function (DUF6627)